MIVLVRKRGLQIDDTQEVVAPGIEFTLAIATCCQGSLTGEQSSAPGSYPEHGFQELTIRRGQSPVKWQCPRCLTLVSLSVVDPRSAPGGVA